ncbi:hypothetical protein [Halorhodospira halochloris]|uniref:hypothetical protein n=1 Tax=Halorhodospira halochloris TaxID=1052 RepID=UPI00076F6496|nr:hypothetical protein [Halorhodospira halochloris]
MNPSLEASWRHPWRQDLHTGAAKRLIYYFLLCLCLFEALVRAQRGYYYLAIACREQGNGQYNHFR